ncbi:NAD(P)/FAD-dependent oxidoreductase [Streptomyces sp. NPDC046925]|uniref:phytoene desaturase family protein n=1 Tax=Streptomyces sp. NPDC046925 TaxID=3155375 RepID=UPI0033D16B44
MSNRPDAAVIGTGPNGLAAAVTLARAGLRVELHEQADTIGGGLRTQPLFASDVTHDICAAVHPMAAASAFFRAFDLAARGVRLIQPDIAYAHPLTRGRAVAAYRSLERTAQELGPDRGRWLRLMEPLVARSSGVVDLILSGQRGMPDDTAAALRLIPRVLAHAAPRSPLRTEEATALLTGVAAHSVGKLPSLASSAVALLLGHLAHSTGWPLPEGGSARIAQAMADDIVAHGGTLHTGHRVTDLREFDGVPLVFCDTSAKGLLAIAGDRLPAGYRRSLERFRYGPGAAKVDFLVSGPIPWTNPVVGRAGTVHLGGSQAEMRRTENDTARGRPGDRPFVLVVDPAVTDPGRASADGRRPVWAYAHVPAGDPRNPVDMVRRHIEHYAPGFGDTVIAERGVPAAELESYNPNYVGGDIGSGAMTLRQSLLRPAPRWDPYRTPLAGVYLCSASTPPGPSVHGMSGYLAARSALRREHHLAPPALAPTDAHLGDMTS